MRRTAFALLILTILPAARSASADEKLDLKQVLNRQLIDPALPAAEARDFTGRRVPSVPPAASVAEWERHAKTIREGVLRHVVFRGEAARWRDAKTHVKWLETIPGGKGYHIRKLRYEALPGLWIPALLYEPEKLAGKVPVVMNVNGHDGKGKVAKYKQVRCINMAKRGMLALNVEWFGMGQLRLPNYSHSRLNQIDLCGSSGLAPFYLSMKRGLDVLLSHEHADPKRVAVAGLSGGGWQTIFISSLDERVTLSNPVAGYSSFKTRTKFGEDLGDSEQTPVDLAVYGEYAHLTALRAPRPTLLTKNANDNCCFKAEHALPPLVEAAAPVFKLYGKRANLRTHVNHDPGTHNFERDNREALYRMFRDHFYRGRKFDATEIPCDDEVKTKEQLQVELPEDNLDFNRIALRLARKLPWENVRGQTLTGLRQWQRAGCRRLRDVLRADDRSLQAIREKTERRGAMRITYWWLRVGGEWTVPGVEIAPAKPQGTSIVIADAGRGSAASTVQSLLKQGRRVLAIDPFYFGESKFQRRGYLWALFVSAVGKRPLGVQAGQLAAVSRWLKRRDPKTPVTVVALGPRTSLIALCAAGLDEPSVGRQAGLCSIDALQLHGSYSSLKEVLEKNMTLQQAPELFCFGLLEQFDVAHLAALVLPRKISFVDVSAAHRKELKSLRDLYDLYAVEHDPLK